MTKDEFMRKTVLLESMMNLRRKLSTEITRLLAELHQHTIISKINEMSQSEKERLVDTISGGETTNEG